MVAPMTSVAYADLPIMVPIQLGDLSLTGVFNGAHWVVEKFDGWDSAELEVHRAARGNRHGVYRGKSFYRGRAIEVAGIVLGDDRQSAHAAHDALTTVVGNAAEDYAALVVSEVITRLAWVQAEATPLKVDWLDHKTFRYSVGLYSDYPFRVGVNLQRLQLVPDEAMPGWTYPRTYNWDYDTDFENFLNLGGQATNNGMAPAYPLFVFHGPLNYPYIDLPKTDQDFRLSTQISEGEFVVVDTWNEIVMLNGTAPRGSWAIGQTFPVMVPGSNAFRLRAEGDGYVNVEWRDTWY
jgi:hypothetical protein